MNKDIKKVKEEMRKVYNELKEDNLNRELIKQLYKFCKIVQKTNDPELWELFEKVYNEFRRVLDKKGKEGKLHLFILERG